MPDTAIASAFRKHAGIEDDLELLPPGALGCLESYFEDIPDAWLDDYDDEQREYFSGLDQITTFEEEDAAFDDGTPKFIGFRRAPIHLGGKVRVSDGNPSPRPMKKKGRSEGSRSRDHRRRNPRALELKIAAAKQAALPHLKRSTLGTVTIRTLNEAKVCGVGPLYEMLAERPLDLTSLPKVPKCWKDRRRVRKQYETVRK